jgi:hypothetical protein
MDVCGCGMGPVARKLVHYDGCSAEPVVRKLAHYDDCSAEPVVRKLAHYDDCIRGRSTEQSLLDYKYKHW